MKLVFKKNISKGFTLLELLVVIAIMAILIALATASYSTAQKKSRDAKRKGDMKALQNAAEQYYSVNNDYPVSDAELKTLVSSNNLPTDPKGGTDYAYTYTYDLVAPLGETYCICSHLEVASSGNATNATCTFATGNYFCVQNLQ